MIGLGTIINVDAEKTWQYYQAMGVSFQRE